MGGDPCERKDIEGHVFYVSKTVDELGTEVGAPTAEAAAQQVATSLESAAGDSLWVRDHVVLDRRAPGGYISARLTEVTVDASWVPTPPPAPKKARSRAKPKPAPAAAPAPAATAAPAEAPTAPAEAPAAPAPKKKPAPRKKKAPAAQE